ncbi:multiubiquitin domain-containing protein [Halodesulfovibrio sp.]|uniref:multiubiquitin domain-containing protein n=1 Tax=Halodesulfovibrio sp. TaxID=1912772 RepID=UPI0025C57EE0|nr:multiubiquitin domain-containing protein [Halodesulfovibrio sp.]
MNNESKYVVVIDQQSTEISDPKVTGRQLLEAVNHFPPEEHLIFQYLSNGQLEELRLDELVDLATEEVEEFFTFKSDASYRFLINGRKFEWGAAEIPCEMVKRLARIDTTSSNVWLEVRGGEKDVMYEDDALIPLDPDGLERLYTLPKEQPNSFEIKINGKKHTVTAVTISGKEILELAGLLPVESYTLRLKIAGERPQKIALDEQIDLSKPGIEKFKALPRDQTEG